MSEKKKEEGSIEQGSMNTTDERITHVNYDEAAERFGDVQDIVELPGDKDAPPLEMTAEIEAELLEGEEIKEKKREEGRSQTKHYDNGRNIWRLIAKTSNEFLDWEHVTTAMNVPGGVVMLVKEAIGQRMHSTAVFVPGAKVEESSIDGKWIIL